jgi:hypothetical protein
MLREGRNTPFAVCPGMALSGADRGQYPGELADADLGVTKSRAAGRQSRLAPPRRALADPGSSGATWPVVGSGGGDVATHVEIQEKLETREDMRRVVPTVVPRLMASGVGQPGERAADHRPVVHDERGLCRQRLQPAARGHAD